jgi:hypothetical protein
MMEKNYISKHLQTSHVEQMEKLIGMNKCPYVMGDSLFLAHILCCRMVLLRPPYARAILSAI